MTSIVSAPSRSVIEYVKACTQAETLILFSSSGWLSLNSCIASASNSFTSEMIFESKLPCCLVGAQASGLNPSAP